jgi:hypothetical protein
VFSPPSPQEDRGERRRNDERAFVTCKKNTRFYSSGTHTILAYVPNWGLNNKRERMMEYLVV